MAGRLLGFGAPRVSAPSPPPRMPPQPSAVSTRASSPPSSVPSGAAPSVPTSSGGGDWYSQGGSGAEATARADYGRYDVLGQQRPRAPQAAAPSFSSVVNQNITQAAPAPMMMPGEAAAPQSEPASMSALMRPLPPSPFETNPNLGKRILPESMYALSKLGRRLY